MTKVNLGDEVLDPITGYKGVAIGLTTWLYGCERITVQMKGVNKEGELYQSQAFDEPQLKIIKKAKKTKVNRRKGGFNIKVMQKK